MRGVVLASALIVVVAACSGEATPEVRFVTTSPSAAVTTAATTTTMVASMPATTTTATRIESGSSTTATAPPVVGHSFTSGTLPDGTPYNVGFEPAVQARAIGASGVVMVEFPDGTSRAIGDQRFERERTAEADLIGNLLTIPAGDWTLHIDLYPEVLDALQELTDAPSTLLLTSFEGGNDRMPLTPLPPFRWADDAEVPSAMEVEYDRFVIRRGCGELALACNETRAVQLIPANAVYGNGLALPDVDSWIESPAPRPRSDPHFLDPGPAARRGDDDVVWTGSEMIIWGGATGDRPPDLVDGFAFDPAASTWREIARAPFAGPVSTRAVWADDRMIVVSDQQTVAYDPRSDTWSALADGAHPPPDSGQMVWTGQHVAMWSVAGVSLLDPSSGEWSALPRPRWGSHHYFEGALRVLDGDLYVSGLRGGRCSSRYIARWTGQFWLELPEQSLATTLYADCSLANQIAAAGGRIVIWDSEDHPTFAYDPKTNRWTEIARIPIAGAEGVSGPLSIAERLLVPRWTEGAIYDPVIDTWTRVQFPGMAAERDMVWTGSEVLMWGAACCYGADDSPFTIDAWRWTPPR